jgi:hypothetical protein
VSLSNWNDIVKAANEKYSKKAWYTRVPGLSRDPPITTENDMYQDSLRYHIGSICVMLWATGLIVLIEIIRAWYTRVPGLSRDPPITTEETRWQSNGKS